MAKPAWWSMTKAFVSRPTARKGPPRAGLRVQDVDVVEINEAFASVILAWRCETDADLAKTNPNGGALAHGHPLGATGSNLMAKPLPEPRRTGRARPRTPNTTSLAAGCPMRPANTSKRRARRCTRAGKPSCPLRFSSIG